MNRQKIKAIFFDLDNTLLDTRELIIRSAYEAAKQFKPALYNYEHFAEMFGKSGYIPFLKSLDPERSSEIISCFKRNKMNHYDSLVKPFPFLIEGLQKLKSYRLKLGVVTSQQRDIVVYGLQRFKLIDLFDSFVAIEDVTKGKPSAEPLLKAMALVEAKSDSSLMVGDSLEDLQSAKNAKVRSVFLDPSGTQLFSECKPDYTFSDFKSFVDHFVDNQKFASEDGEDPNDKFIF